MELVASARAMWFVSTLALLQELESRVTPLNAEYWGCLLTLAEHELEAQRCAWAWFC
jgi:hypothetical protein